MNRSKAFRLSTLALVTAALGFTAGTLHFELDKSAPEADAQVTAIESIDLWFTQVPQDKTTAIRLLNASGDLVETSAVVQDGEDAKHQSVEVAQTLAPGGYTVVWRSMAADGHTVRDDFSFTVVTEDAGR